MRRMGLVAAWFLVLILATALTWQIVSAADDQVSDRPVAPLNVSAPALNSTTTTSVATSQSIPSTTLPRSDTSPTTVPDTTATSNANQSSSTSSTTTTEAGSAWKVKTVNTAGGSVVLSYRPEEVVLEAATPAPGFRADIEDSGPPKVEVEFESERTKFKVHAEWHDGALDVEVSEED